MVQRPEGSSCDGSFGVGPVRQPAGQSGYEEFRGFRLVGERSHRGCPGSKDVDLPGDVVGIRQRQPSLVHQLLDQHDHRGAQAAL